MPEAWGYSDAAIRQYTKYVNWFKEMAERFNLPAPVGVARMQRAFWSCYCATKVDAPFERYDELERGLEGYQKDGRYMPTFQGLIARPKDGVYGVEKLLSHASRVNPEAKVDWGDDA